MNLSRAHEEHLRELLQSANVARDSLPYTEEFERLKKEYWGRTFKQMSNAEFWTALVSVAKQGGVRGKRKSNGSPTLREEHAELLKKLLPVPIGQRDRLPYTESLSKLVVKFNQLAETALTERQLWLAILHIAK